VLRLFAAFLVFHSHFSALRGHIEPSLPWAPTNSYGAEGVLIFFAISGSLVGRSALERSPLDFLVSRILRIQPALIVCTLILLGIGAACTSLPLTDYFSHADTLNFLNTAVAWLGTSRSFLPGVFTNRPFPYVDGSLWTLHYEIYCYGCLLLGAVIGPRAIKWGAIAALGPFIIDIFSTNLLTQVGFISRHAYFEFTGVFAIGVLTCFLNRPQFGRALLAASILLILSWNSETGRNLAWHIFLALGAIYLGRYARLDRFLPKGLDISYGFYIYAYPMTQLAQTWLLHASHGKKLSYFVALFMSIALATASWFLVERRTLALRPRVSRWLETRIPAILAEP